MESVNQQTELVTIDEAARLLACHRMTVRRRMASGELGQVVKDGRKYVRLRRSAIEAYIQKHTQEG